MLSEMGEGGGGGSEEREGPGRYRDAPFHKVARPLVRERMEAMAGHDLSADHVRPLLLGVIVTACSDSASARLDMLVLGRGEVRTIGVQ